MQGKCSTSELWPQLEIYSNLEHHTYHVAAQIPPLRIKIFLLLSNTFY